MNSETEINTDEKPKLSAIKPACKIPLRGEQAKRFEEILCDENENRKPLNVVWLNSKRNEGIETDPHDENDLRSQQEKNLMRLKGRIGYIDGVLSASECEALVAEIKSSPHLSFWSEQGREDEDARSFRDAFTIEVESAVIAEKLWSRVSSLLLSEDLSFSIASDDDGSDMWRVDLPGRWSPAGLNGDLLFAHYRNNGFFSPHTDGNAIADFNLRSFYSVILYLNDIPEGHGGETVFFLDEASKNLTRNYDFGGGWDCENIDLLAGRVSAKRGRLCFFDQRLLHEGAPVSEKKITSSPIISSISSPISSTIISVSGAGDACGDCAGDACGDCASGARAEKVILRSDIMFARSPALLTRASDCAAYALFREAEALAERARPGDTERAVALFRKSFKQSPQLARLMGQA